MTEQREGFHLLGEEASMVDTILMRREGLYIHECDGSYANVVRVQL